ncbi:hypothetical protein ABPG75_008167 [Micractinium tetrahymenae]
MQAATLAAAGCLPQQQRPPASRPRPQRPQRVALCRASASMTDGQSKEPELVLPERQLITAGVELPSQGQAVVAGVGDADYINRQLMEILAPKTDYLAEFLAIQNEQPRNVGFFGTRNMGFMHQQLIEVLSYAMLLTGNHIFTSGATGTNAAVIRGALRAEKPELLTVVLPQSMSRQPQESQELLQQVENIVDMPQNDGLSLLEASRICNQDIIRRVQQVICFAFHDSNLLLETCQQARAESKIVTQFFLD